MSSPSTVKASKAQEVCKGCYRRARGVYKGKGVHREATGESMVDFSPWLGSRLHQDEGEDGLQEGETFRAKALRRIKCKSAHSCWEVTMHLLSHACARARTGSAEGGRETAASTRAHCQRERKRFESGAHCWAEPNPKPPASHSHR